MILLVDGDEGDRLTIQYELFPGQPWAGLVVYVATLAFVAFIFWFSVPKGSATPAPTGRSQKMLPAMSRLDTVGDNTEEPVAKANRSIRARQLRDDYFRRRRAHELSQSYRSWENAGQVGTDPISLAISRLGESGSDSCW